MTSDVGDAREASLRKITAIIYALYALSIFLGGVTAVIAIVMNYVKRADTAGTWLESHFRWQIRTFWFALLWSVIGALTVAIVVGWVVLAGTGIWVIYRLVKGALALYDGKPLYVS